MSQTHRDNFSTIYETERRPYTKGLLFRDMKDAVLGKKYILSLVFIQDKDSKRLNNKYRSKNKPTNVLSFPLSKTEGEIFINTDAITREFKDFGMSKKDFIAFLYIHALFHLKGLDHGSTMEREEKKIRTRFGIDTANT